MVRPTSLGWFQIVTTLRIVSKTTEKTDMKHMGHSLERQDIRSNRSFLKQTDSILFYSYINDLHINYCGRL